MAKKRGKIIPIVFGTSSIVTAILGLILIFGLVQTFATEPPLGCMSIKDYENLFKSPESSDSIGGYTKIDNYEFFKQGAGTNFYVLKDGVQVFSGFGNYQGDKFMVRNLKCSFCMGNYPYTYIAYKYIPTAPIDTTGKPYDANGETAIDFNNALISYGQTQGVKAYILTDYYFDNTVNIIKVKVDSNVPSNIDAVAKAYIIKEATTPTVGTFYKDFSKRVLIQQGSHEIQFVLPPDFDFGSYKFSFELLLPITTKQGGSEYPSIDGFSSCSFTKSLSLTPRTEKLFLINPRKTTIELLNGQTLPEDYVFQLATDSSTGTKESGTCIKDPACILVRSDLREQSCWILGCPQNVDRTYSCTSTGYCAEVISQVTGCTSDIDCGTNTGLFCDISSGTCFMETIKETLYQCQTASMCNNPCGSNTLSISCVDSKCVYEGNCSITLTPKDCHTDGCPDDTYTCTNLGVCERTLTSTITEEKIIINTIYEKAQSNIQQGNPPLATVPQIQVKDITLEQKEKFFTRTKVLWVFGISLIVTIISGLWWFLTKRKK